jgi:hypothetical protein
MGCLTGDFWLPRNKHILSLLAPVAPGLFALIFIIALFALASFNLSTTMPIRSVIGIANAHGTEFLMAWHRGTA